MLNLRNRRYFWLVLIAGGWAAFIFATSCTVVTTDQLFAFIGLFVSDASVQQFELFWGIAWFTVVKSWHVTEFGILTVCLIALFQTLSPHRPLRSVGPSAFLAVLFAASDELHQTYVPQRGGTIWDVLIDSLDRAIVCLIALVRIRSRTRELISRHEQQQIAHASA